MEIKFHEKHWHGQMPALEVTDATKEFHTFLCGFMYENRMKHPDYQAKSEAHPFFQGGIDYESSGGWILIEYWSNVVKAKECFDYIMERWNEECQVLGDKK